jgi:hypothetical protein
MRRARGESHRKDRKPIARITAILLIVVAPGASLSKPLKQTDISPLYSGTCTCCILLGWYFEILFKAIHSVAYALTALAHKHPNIVRR